MDIKQSPVGKILQAPEGYSFFVPNPLPPTIKWTNQLVFALSRADFLLGKLAREGNRLPNPHLLIRPFIFREAVLSSKIEGTRATIGEVLVADAEIEVTQTPDDLQEVQNYIHTLERGIKRLNDLPLCLRLVKELHKDLMQGVRGFHATPGEFRKSPNWIGTPGCSLNTAEFIPPNREYLMDCLGSFEKFLHNRQLPPLIHIALCHYQFEAIHPFLDGNGRVGRLLITLLLIEEKMLPSPLLYLSAFFEATRSEYYRQLYSLSAKGTWQEWLIYFLNGVALQSEDVLSRAERINALLDKWKIRIAQDESRTSIKIVEQLAVNPYLSTNKLAKDLNIAYTTASRGIQKLEKLRIVKRINSKKRGQGYCATEIRDILEEPTKVQSNLEG